jgi:deoxyribose-phosphate aldolase
MNVASLIDHTLLRADATAKQIEGVCEEGLKYEFASVCVNPVWVSVTASLLKGSEVKVCSVVGFPLGSLTPKLKALEAEDAVSNGANELDMVMNIGALKSGYTDWVREEIEGVLQSGAVLKVIIETGLLSEEAKVMACSLAREGGAHFVKTCTGFGPGRATIEDVRLMRRTVGTEMGVKASGGIRRLAEVKALVDAGATRIGTSTGVQIVREAADGTRDEGTA